MTSSGIRVYLISFRFLGKYVASFPVPDHWLYIPWLSHLHSRILSQRSHRLQTHCFGYVYVYIHILYIMWLCIDTLFLMFYMHIYILYIYTHTYVYIYIFIHIQYTPCWLDGCTLRYAIFRNGAAPWMPWCPPRECPTRCVPSTCAALRATSDPAAETPARKHILGCHQSSGFFTCIMYGFHLFSSFKNVGWSRDVEVWAIWKLGRSFLQNYMKNTGENDDPFGSS